MIVIDGFALLFLPGGIKSYLIALIKALNASPAVEGYSFTILLPEVPKELSAFQHKEIQELQDTLNKNFSIKYATISPYFFKLFKLSRADDATIRRYTLFFWEKYFLPKSVRTLNPEVVLHPYQAVSDYRTSARKIVVIHDIFHWIENKEYSFVVKKMYDSYKKGCIECTKIITISKASKEEIVNLLDISEEKVAVCYEGVDDLFLRFRSTPNGEKEIKDFYQLPEKYLLALVSVREYKNILGVLESFKIVSDKDPKMRLVLVGWALGANAQVKNFINENQLESRIVSIPKLRRHEDLAFLYSMSFAFLFLSFKEGFGLPPLEAVASGTLAVVSNVSAVGEIYNGILPSFPPKDYKGISANLLNLTKDKRLKEIESARKTLLGLYTWEKVLPRYLKAFAN